MPQGAPTVPFVPLEGLIEAAISTSKGWGIIRCTSASAAGSGGRLSASRSRRHATTPVRGVGHAVSRQPWDRRHAAHLRLDFSSTFDPRRHAHADRVPPPWVLSTAPWDGAACHPPAQLPTGGRIVRDLLPGLSALPASTRRVRQRHLLQFLHFLDAQAVATCAAIEPRHLSAFVRSTSMSSPALTPRSSRICAPSSGFCG